MAGTGKRARNARKRRARSAARPHYPFMVDQATLELLGPEALNELAENLHPVDCQTCGWPLGTTTPSLLVADLAFMASATLHHPRCQPAGRNSNFFLGGGGQDLVSWRSAAFAVGAGPTRDLTRAVPLLLVNPHLEYAMLRSDDSGWRVSNADPYRAIGMKPAADFTMDSAISTATASIDGTTVKVEFSDMPQAFDADGSGLIKEIIRDRGGLQFAITTKLDPSSIDEEHQLHAAMTDGATVIGWVALDTATSPPPASAVPDAVTTYLLHVGPSHASVSRYVAHNPGPLDEHAAQDWARKTLTASADQLDLWRQINGDSNAWLALDLASARHILLRRVPTGWQLFQVLRLIDGNPDVLNGPQEWAASAIRTKDHHHVLGWSRETDPPSRFTTWLGTAAAQPGAGA
jgi:hypothetical protein